MAYTFIQPQFGALMSSYFEARRFPVLAIVTKPRPLGIAEGKKPGKWWPAKPQSQHINLFCQHLYLVPSTVSRQFAPGDWIP